MPTAEWDVYIVNEVREWINQLDEPVHARVVHAIDALAVGGPGLGRPLVDTIAGAKIQNLKELRPGTVRILFAFDHGAQAFCWSQATSQDNDARGTRRRSHWPNNGMRFT